MSALSSANRPIVVGVDGSPASEAALRWALTTHVATDYPVRAVMVASPPVVPLSSLDGFAGFPDPDPDPFDAAVLLQRTVNRAVADPAARATIEQRVVMGGVLESLLAQAGEASLLVIGQGGRSLSRRLLSTARQVVVRAPCPVVVVPPAPYTPAHLLAPSEAELADVA
ncbi:MAG: universal stress protein [Acidimicrobiia bacterium]|nr:universal stress protein [Acidimicrobiia bacterium]MDH4363429.1 universal stress protein [Acidimicrobiia bacterium]